MLLLYAVTLFLSSTLLFLIQPMVGKMILPSLGGTPAVWNTCMVFFQTALLGYLYAHGSVALFGVRRQAALHLVLLSVPLLVLPIAVEVGSAPPADNPVFWLLGRLALWVGLPFFVVSSSAPLLQKWFANTAHPEAKDPYFLYAASNLGSMLALLGYPMVVEPLLPLVGQSRVWAGGFILLIAATLACAIALWRSRAVGDPSPTPGRDEAPAVGDSFSNFGEYTNDGARAEGDSSPTPRGDGAPTLRRRLWWVVLAFIPSSLMLGVTTHVTTDIAPVPLLWVVPLALYLLSFVLVFARRPPIPHSAMVWCLPFVMAPVALSAVRNLAAWGSVPILVHLFAFFVAAMVCHGELARDRPATKHLTGYYLWLSIGGVLGGLFNAVIAPVVFETVAEYPLVMVLACLVLVRRGWGPARRWARTLDFGLPVLLGLATGGLIWVLIHTSRAWEGEPITVTVGVPAVLCLLLARRRPVRFGLCVGAAVAVSAYCLEHQSQDVLYKGRNFFGVKSVTADPEGVLHTFVHGKTIHGRQATDPRHRRMPLAYYHRTGPVGDVFKTAGDKTRRRVAVLGLGAGSMACYAEPGEQFTFYEIDPEVERIARNPEYFTFLADCLGRAEVIIGDGRLTLAEAPERHYGLIFLDAFSSDAVPTHLLTREALQLYLSKLDERGMLIFNITNQYLDLAPLLAALAADAGLVCLSRLDPANQAGDFDAGKFQSRYVVMARSSEDVRRLDYDPNWNALSAPPNMKVWTDQYSNIFSVVRWAEWAWTRPLPGKLVLRLADNKSTNEGSLRGR